MFLDRWKIREILHNQVQQSEFAQPWVVLNAVNVKDGAAHSLTTDWTMGRAERCGPTVAADGSKCVSVSRHRSLFLMWFMAENPD